MAIRRSREKIFETLDPYLNVVRLEAGTWDNHIWPRHGDQMPGTTTVEVRSLVEKPAGTRLSALDEDVSRV